MSDQQWAGDAKDQALASTAFELEKLRTAVRKHMHTRGDDRCHLDDGELYAALPEGDTRPERETAVTIENCHRFIDCRQRGREYVSPQRRIEELEAEVKRLKRENDLLSDTGHFRIGLREP